MNSITQSFLKEVEKRAGDIGLSPQAVVTEAGMTARLWDRWTADEGDPSVETMEKINAVLDRLEVSI